MIIRSAGHEGVRPALALLDRAAEWLVSLGRTGQWGTQKQSTSPRRLAQAQGWAESGGFYLGWIGEEVVGALVVGDAPEHIPPAGEPELYVNLLVTDRVRMGEGLGTALLDYAREVARDRNRELLRLDCYRGDDGALVRYYERQGFTKTVTFEVGGWPGQVLAQRL